MATQTLSDKSIAEQFEKAEARVTMAPAAAAMISGGIGVFVIGLMTTGAVISAGLKSALSWWDPSGPLSGKTGIGVLAWLASWFLLNTFWKGKDANLAKAFTTAVILIILGLVLTFPPVFEAFE